MLPAQSLEQLLDFEGNLESGFVACLKASGLQQVSSSRSDETFKSPFVSLYVVNGAALIDQQYNVPGFNSGGANPFTTYDATLVTEISTNRSDESEGKQPHTVFVAQVRKALLLFRINAIWLQFQQIALPFFIREDGSQYSFDSEHNIDITTINWALKHSINPQAWPAQLFN